VGWGGGGGRVKKRVVFVCLFLLEEFGKGKSIAGVFGCDIKPFVDSDMFEQKKHGNQLSLPREEQTERKWKLKELHET
jgi:hypothetical protein